MVQRAYVDAQAVLADGSHFQLARDQWEAFCRELDAPVKISRHCGDFSRNPACSMPDESLQAPVRLADSTLRERLWR